MCGMFGGAHGFSDSAYATPVRGHRVKNFFLHAPKLLPKAQSPRSPSLKWSFVFAAFRGRLLLLGAGGGLRLGFEVKSGLGLGLLGSQEFLIFGTKLKVWLVLGV